MAREAVALPEDTTGSNPNQAGRIKTSQAPKANSMNMKNTGAENGACSTYCVKGGNSRNNGPKPRHSPTIQSGRTSPAAVANMISRCLIGPNYPVIFARPSLHINRIRQHARPSKRGLAFFDVPVLN